MTLEADLERLILRQGRERAHANVDGGPDAAGAREVHVAAAGPVAGLAVDGERGELRLVPPSDRVERDADLAAVALLTALEALGAAEDAIGRPVSAVRQRNRRSDRG